MTARRLRRRARRSRAFAAGGRRRDLRVRERARSRAVDALAPLVPVRPGRRALEVAQDRLAEKEFLERPRPRDRALRARSTAPEALAAALARLGAPAILKTRRLRLRRQGAGAARRRRLGGRGLGRRSAAAPSVLEGFVAFEREISVIAARGLDGAVAAFDPGENVHRDGILRRTTVPARVPPAVAQDAVLIAGRILNALDYVGVIGVEMFVTARRARGQRDRAAGAQLRPLDRGGLPRSTSSSSTSAPSAAGRSATGRGTRTPRW